MTTREDDAHCGGLYKEICLVPDWNAEYGSGGRAAAAVARLSPSTVLHAYAPVLGSSGQDELERLGVKIRLQPSSHGVVFAYFHPLPTPHIEPCRSAMVQHAPIELSGEAVLRFGFLEGEAIVHANRAVYDPQTSVSPPMFADNGSSANELALVLNEADKHQIVTAGALAVIPVSSPICPIIARPNGSGAWPEPSPFFSVTSDRTWTDCRR